MRAAGGAAGQRTGNLRDKVPSPASRRAAPPSGPADRRTDGSTHGRICPALESAMSGSSSVAAMKKVVQQLRLEAGLNRVKVSGGGRPRGRGWRRRREGSGGRGGWGGRHSRPAPASPGEGARSVARIRERPTLEK